MGKVSGWMKENEEFLKKCAIYGALNIGDAVLINELASLGILEDNPVVDYLIGAYGLLGPYIAKAESLITGICAMYLADECPERTRIKSKHVFLIGSGGYTTGLLCSIYWLVR